MERLTGRALGRVPAGRGDNTAGPAAEERAVEHDIPREEYERIQAMIGDETSPVGIDARKTHIIIIHKLISLEKRLARLERERGRT
jgi:hypothetical protein